MSHTKRFDQAVRYYKVFCEKRMEGWEGPTLFGETFAKYKNTGKFREINFRE